MQPSRWKEAAPWVEQLLDATSARRREVLEPLAEHDPELAREVESLLRADRGTSSGADSGPIGQLLDGRQLGTPDQWLGRVVGAYRIEEVLGSGGMSTVFKAQRIDGSFDRPVALKLLGRSFHADARRRFDVERGLLARLEHPGIARLYDGGTTDDGVPYLVMEWVDGEPIDAYCDRLRLKLRERIELVLELAEAVSWAHRHLVVHRDIKPANVLVDSEGRPRLLDFGIGKALDGDAAATVPGVQPMTVAWASPEQIRGQPVSTPSDVYSLGVLLYWLLTGVAPCGDPGDSGHALERAIVDDEPVPPSQTFAAAVPGAAARALARSSQPAHLERALRGDLDAVLSKVLAKRPDQRYHQVSDLAADLRRFLEDRPVEASRPHAFRLALKFARRHRAGVGALLVVGAALLFAVWQSLAASERMGRQRDLAQAKRAEADQMTEIALRLLQQSEATGGEVARAAVDALLAEYRARLDVVEANPASTASSLHALGVVQRELGRQAEARELLQRAVELRTEAYGERSLERSESLEQLATLHQGLGDLERAEAGFEEVLDVRVRLLGASDPDTAMAHNNLGLVIWEQGRFVEAEPHLRAALEVARKTLGPRHPGTLSATSNLALILQGQERRTEAEELHRLALEGVTEVFGPDHPRWATAANNLGTLLRKTGGFEEAAQLQEQVIAVREAHYGAEHPDTASAIQNLGYIEFERGHLDRAEALMRQARALRVAALGASHPLVESSNRGLARVHAAQEESEDPGSVRQRRSGR